MYPRVKEAIIISYNHRNSNNISSYPSVIHVL